MTPKPNQALRKDGKSVAELLGAPLPYKPDAKEQKALETAMAKWIGRSGLPARTVEDEDFVEMMRQADKRFNMPKKTKINNLINKYYNDKKVECREQVAAARQLTIGLDIWTKQGLTASFLAVSACLFCNLKKAPVHIMLQLVELDHPHTAHSIKVVVDTCLEDWGIPKEKVLTFITDNGSNMVAAFKDDEGEDDEGEPTSTEEDDEVDEEDSRSLAEEQRYD